MSALLPRSRSECLMVKVKLPKSNQGEHRGKGGGGLSASSPELRSMLIHLNTTVPQNIFPPTLSSTHTPRSRGRHKFGRVVEWIERLTMPSCCGVRVMLVILQIFLGCAITGVSTYVHLYVPAIRLREKPFWAGVPLLFAGLSGVFFCIKDKKTEEISMTLLVIKTACSVVAAISIFLCVTAAVFCGIHVGQLFTYAYCEHLDNGCLCFHSLDQLTKTYLYTPVHDCFFVYCYIKIFIITAGSLCVLGSLVACTFVVTIWRSRYGQIDTALE
ncbi:unnamed protein product [Lymnaea stagnalis]|uniref:Sarcospan n=1 Tax=Lymnaea stagnalis TaxID=6523 RepID=A0AAV2H2A8_LYMST